MISWSTKINATQTQVWWPFGELKTMFKKKLRQQSKYGRRAENLHHRKLTCPLKMDCFSREYICQPLIFRGHSLVFRGVASSFCCLKSSDPPTFPPDIHQGLRSTSDPMPAPRSNKFFFRSEAAENFPEVGWRHTKKDGENGKKTPRAARFPIGMLERVTFKKRRFLWKSWFFNWLFE